MYKVCWDRPKGTIGQNTGINLSKTPFDEEAWHVLNKSLNFALIPKRIPYDEIIFDGSIATLKEVPIDTAHIMRR